MTWSGTVFSPRSMRRQTQWNWMRRLRPPSNKSMVEEHWPQLPAVSHPKTSASKTSYSKAAMTRPGRKTKTTPGLRFRSEQKYGGGTLAPVAGGVAPENIGIEDLVLESSYDKTRPKDEDHSWIAI